ncbi:MAG: hypothetical protein ACREK9_05930 [Candidatus Rokuibacteriota bacterium]
MSWADGGSRDPRAIEQEITRLRDELGALGDELERRWHDLTDVRLQVRRHGLAVTLSALAAGAAAAGSVALGIRRARRRSTLVARGRRLRDAVGRMVERPERVAVDATATQRIIAAAGSAVAAFAIKAALERLARNRPRR